MYLERVFFSFFLFLSSRKKGARSLNNLEHLEHLEDSKEMDLFWKLEKKEFVSKGKSTFQGSKSKKTKEGRNPIARTFTSKGEREREKKEIHEIE